MSNDKFSIDNSQVPEGYKQTEVGVIPEDWRITNLGEVSSIIDPQPDHRTPPEASGGEPYIGISDFINDTSVDWDGCRKVISKALDKQQARFQLCCGDIIFGKIGTIGLPKFVPITSFRYALSANVILVKPKLEPYFLMSCLKSSLVQKEINKELHSTSQAAFGILKMRDLLIAIPPLPEQCAIARALSDADTLIAALDKQLAKKRHIKTATMQQLLTGKKRLPGFGEGKGYKKTDIGVIPEDWKVKTLINVASQPLQNGIFNNPLRKGKGCKLINVIDLYSNIPINIENLELFDADPSKIKRFGVFQGDIFFTRSSLTPDGIAHCNIYTEIEHNIVFDCHLIRFRPNKNLISTDFLFRYCVTSIARKYLVTYSKTTTMTTIDQGVISQLPIPLPSLKEQQAIAQVLTDIDIEIAALEKRRAKTQAIKQGMMQELLTGRTRLV